MVLGTAATDGVHNPPVSGSSRRHLTRLPQKSQPTAPARLTIAKNDRPRSGLDKQAAPDGFALDLAHCDIDHQDADFVKY